MTKTVAIYARQSLDRLGDELAVTRQLDACRAYAAERGWAVSAEYVDNDKSATSGKTRPAFEALLEAKPEAILVWHVDRLQRRVTDLELVIALGVDVHAIKAGHLDLSTPSGRAVARTITAWAQYETEQKSIRQMTANDQRAAAGLPLISGRRPFGYERDGMTVRVEEAQEVLAAALRLLDGGTIADVLADWHERGINTPLGKPFGFSTLRHVLTSPRTHGLRQHRGEIVGPAAWPALLDPDTSIALRALLSDPGRKHGRKRVQYLLSGVMVCGVCQAPVKAQYRNDRGWAVYLCSAGAHVTRRVELVDKYVLELVAERLRTADAAELFADDADAGVNVHELRVEAATLRKRLDELGELFAIGELDRASIVAGTRRIKSRLAAIDEAIAKTVGAPRLARYLSSDDPAADFLAGDDKTRREVIDRTVRIMLMPTKTGRPVEDGVALAFR